MATNCANQLTNLDPTCEALKKKGGLKKKIWVAPYDGTTITLDVDGNIDTITLPTTSPATTIKYFIGRKLKHNGTLTGEVGENANTINQALNMVLYYYTQDERAAIDNLFQTEEVLVFVQTEGGQIEMWGYETGLLPTALTGGTGTALNDSTAVTVTLSGSQDTLPKVCKFGATLADDIAYLEALE